MTTDHPVFVPFRGEHLAAVITVPESDPRALVTLLQGLGAPRSHRYSLWTRIAGELANRGIASVRLDYPEMGDSTGSFPGHMDDPPVEEALAVTNAALEIVGVESFGAVGNCLGAKTALMVAARVESCLSVSCIIPGSPKSILIGEGRTAPHRAARRLSKRAPRLGAFGRRVLQSHRIKPRLRFLPEVAESLRGSDLMLLFLGDEEPAARLGNAIGAFAAHVAPGERRPEVRRIPAGVTSGMRLSLELQPQVVDAIVEWFDQTLPGSTPGRGADATAEPETSASSPMSTAQSR